MTHLPVSEVFGPVWQGEGPHTGRRCSFLRLGLCNLRCSWCDTPFTWDVTRFDVAAECPPRTPQFILDALNDHGTDLLILTGGEPLIHQRTAALWTVLDAYPGEVHVETNGTLAPTIGLAERVAHFSVSPKLANGGDLETRRQHGAALAGWGRLARADKAVFKFVVTAPSDLSEVQRTVDRFGFPVDKVWIMPEGVDGDTLLRTARIIAPAVADAGYHFTLRQHTLLYGTERAR